jgi:hypothetical protein
MEERENEMRMWVQRQLIDRRRGEKGKEREREREEMKSGKREPRKRRETKKSYGRPIKINAATKQPFHTHNVPNGQENEGKQEEQ